MTTLLTDHISLEEMVFSEAAARLGIDNTPDPVSLVNLDKTAVVMEEIRKRLDHPVIIHSGYRAPKVNEAIGGVATSAHLKGLACDFICPGYGSPFQVAIAIMPWLKDLRIDQLIREYGWVHVGLRDEEPRYELLTKRSAEAHYESGILS
jgi:hypothetical protein